MLPVPDLQAVVPSLEMDAATLTKHLQARHLAPFAEVGLHTIDATPRDLKVWQAYHQREHSVYDDHDHYHTGEDGDPNAGEPQEEKGEEEKAVAP